MFYTTEEHPLLKVLEDNYEVILEDYKSIKNDCELWSENSIHNGKWEAYGIMFKGEHLPNKCPRTTEIVKSIPGVYIAGFSVLKAGGIIKPHKGYTTGVWRSHLGLMCPDKCWIKVGGVEHRWKKGAVAVFDDTNTHEAVNESNEDRVVLIVDIER
jgi:beta-hydroxylase